ncbi:MAG TPA: hypothetical protein VE955_02895 [Candidatus Dormibacteraeota bacterium]|nr:hypothetical protein [Candidatus Dormibacteraeota bacterium]
MRSLRIFVPGALLLAIFAIVIPSMTPHVYAAAKPCSPKCAIAILSPGSGGVLNSHQDVNPSFVVSFLVNNFTLVQPGTNLDVNTTTTGSGAHNQGHIHVFVDNIYVTIWASVNGIPLTLSTGTHIVRLDLVNDFHQEFSPGINASTTVNVVDPTQSAANNAMYYSLGALVVAIIAVILVAYVAFKPKQKTA